MTATLAIVMALVLFAATMLWRALGAMCEQEIETRIGRLPNALIRVAALRLPRDVRSDLADEWKAELDFIVSGTDGLPVTRLLRGLHFAASLLRVAPSVAHELTCTCTRRSRLWTVAGTTWFLLFSAGISAEVIIAFDSLVRSHHTAAGISAAVLALGSVIIRRPPWVIIRRPPWISMQAPIEVHGGFRFAIGILAVATGLLIHGGGWDVAFGVLGGVESTALILLCWMLSRLSMELTLAILGRGTRVGVGPHWLRLHVGAGGTGISTGAGPVTWYRPLRRRRRQS
jgi:hypothetical protein